MGQAFQVQNLSSKKGIPMVRATKEENCMHAKTGDLQEERWWVWKKGRRVYTTVEPGPMTEANKRRNVRRKAQRAMKAPA